MPLPIITPKMSELATEIDASFTRLRDLLGRLGAYPKETEKDRGRDVRMSVPQIRRILARTRVLLREAPPEKASPVLEQVDKIETDLDLTPWLRDACEHAEALRVQFVNLVGQTAEAYTVEMLHELKRVARETGTQELNPHMRVLQNVLRKLHSDGRGREQRRARRMHRGPRSKTKKPEQTKG